MHIALDAMAGDNGPEELITGALLAAKQADLRVSLVGDEVLLQKHLDQLAPDIRYSRIHKYSSRFSGNRDG